MALIKAYREFPEEVKKKFVESANHVLDNFVFKAWDEAEMKEKWRKRSLSQILNSGEINHLFPCLDASAIAVKYLKEAGGSPRLKLLTESGAVDAFRNKKSRALHIDSFVELPYEGVNYCLNIGCGDVILYKPFPPDGSDELEEKYLTTRPEKHERFWHRTPFLVLDGKTMAENQEIPLLNFVNSEHNMANVPYGIEVEEFHEALSVNGKKSFLLTNQDYDLDASTADNREWLAQNLKFLPDLKEYRYSK